MGTPAVISIFILCFLYLVHRQRNRFLRGVHFWYFTRQVNINEAGDDKAVNVKSQPNFDLKTLLPPSRRHTLGQPTVLNSSTTHDGLLEDNLVTPTGFKPSEVRALLEGKLLPDFAKFSGMPLPEPVPTAFDIENAKPRPYRPLRWPYHQTMALQKLEPSMWLELHSNYKSAVTERLVLFQRHGKRILDSLPGSELACTELVQCAAQFLCVRYPQCFSLSSCSERLLHNRILEKTSSLVNTPPLQILINHIPEDFAILERNTETGRYFFTAGVICSSIGWDLGSKLGKELSDIHKPVPFYAQRMAKSMDRWFAKVPTDGPIQRGAWDWEWGRPLYVPPCGEEQRWLEEERERWCEENGGVEDPERDMHFRVDWQTLRRLPLTGAIAFNFRVMFNSIRELKKEPYVPALALKVVEDGPKEILDYKGTKNNSSVVKEILRRYVKEQVEQGVIPNNWEHQTLDESPYFPGWENEWKASYGYD